MGKGEDALHGRENFDDGRCCRGSSGKEGTLNLSSHRFRSILADNLPLYQIHDVLGTVDTELSATSLTEAQLAESKLFVFLTPQRKVIACAVVQRITEAYKVVGSKSLSAESPSPSPETKDDFLRFGEDEGAIFCE